MSESNNEPKRHRSPAAFLASLAVRPRAMVWGGLCMLLQFVWAFISATVGLYFLVNAPSNADINVWAMRVLMVFCAGISGSLAIQIAWMGRSNIATFKFWGSWLVVNVLCSAVAIPLAMALVPI